MTPRRSTALHAALAVSGLTLLLASGPGLRPAAAGQYLVQEIGTLGGNTSVATAINDAGQVIGFSTTAAGSQHAFLFSNGVLQDLGTLGGSASTATALNGAGQVVGFSLLPDDQACRAFLWSKGKMQTLPALGGTESYATGINAAGQIVGSVSTAQGASRAFIYSQGVTRDLVMISGLGTALGISDAGNVLGVVSDGWVTRACLHTESGLVDLGTLGGSNTDATAISAAGQAVGGSDTVGNRARHAFRWTRGVMEDLGALGNRDSIAYGINRAGQVVGGSYVDGDLTRHAFLYTDGTGMVDLNARIDPSLGWKLVDAQGINESGQIVGWGYHNGLLRAFRLSPGGTN
jgi:probable HAF family extracellular repeat protein